jgi:hypothetical protein
MPAPARIFALLEEALTTGRPAEEICADCAELLEELRRRIAQCEDLDSQLGGMSPSSATTSLQDAANCATG